MLRFFSKIRKALLADRGMRKYTLYAIGEIVLVVAGILIALQINNWNEERKQAILGQELLMELMLEMQQDISSLEWSIGTLEWAIEKQEAILLNENIRSLSLDSIADIFTKGNVDIQSDQITLAKIKSAGITRLTSNDSLNQKITKYFDRSVLLANRRIEWYQKYFDQDWRLLIYEQNAFDYYHNIEFPAFDQVSDEEQKEALIAYINQPRTKMTIKRSNTLMRSALEYFTRTRNDLVDLVQEIHAEVSRYRDDVPALPEYALMEVPED